jgi:hypothetical protein
MNSLGQWVRRAAARLPDGLVSAEALRAVEAVAAWFPADITDSLCFELELRAGAAASDVAFICRRDSHGARILAGRGSSMLREDLLDDPIWQRILAFGRAWAADPVLRENVSHLWFEFDVRPEPSRPVPILFLGIPEHRGPDVGWLSRAFELLGVPAAKRFVDYLQRSLASPALAAKNFHVGLMFPRDTTHTRLVFHNVNAGIFRALSDLGVPEDEALTSVATDLLRVTDVVHLDVDAGDSIGPRIGLECQFSGNVVGDRARWPGALGHLVAIGCCTPEKAGALLRWPGGSMERLDHFPLPVQVIRKINSFKIDYQRSLPLRAKAYLLARTF